MHVEGHVARPISSIITLSSATLDMPFIMTVFISRIGWAVSTSGAGPLCPCRARRFLFVTCTHIILTSTPQPYQNQKSGRGSVVRGPPRWLFTGDSGDMTTTSHFGSTMSAVGSTVVYANDAWATDANVFSSITFALHPPWAF